MTRVSERRAAGMPEGMYLAGIPERERIKYLCKHPAVAEAVKVATERRYAQIAALKNDTFSRGGTDN